MEEGKRRAIILALLAQLRSQDSWSAETHVQKCGHLLQEGLGVSLDLEFIMYKHGPFSFELRELLGELRASQLLEVTARPPYGPSLSPSDTGVALIDRYPRTVSMYSQQIKFVTDELGSLDALQLEKIGTALYVTRSPRRANKEERVKEFLRLKPHVDKSAAIAAIEQVDNLLARAPKAARLG